MGFDLILSEIYTQPSQLNVSTSRSTCSKTTFAADLLEKPFKADDSYTLAYLGPTPLIPPRRLASSYNRRWKDHISSSVYPPLRLTQSSKYVRGAYLRDEALNVTSPDLIVAMLIWMGVCEPRNIYGNLLKGIS